MFEQLEKYIEATLAALVALLAWCWRIARHDQERGQRIAALEAWRQEHMAQYRDIDKKLDELVLHEARKDEQLCYIKETVDSIDTALGASRRGGSRWYDPPEGQP